MATLNTWADSEPEAEGFDFLCVWLWMCICSIPFLLSVDRCLVRRLICHVFLSWWVYSWDFQNKGMLILFILAHHLQIRQVSSVWYNQADETLIVFYFKQAATGHSKQKQVSEWEKGSLWLEEILMNGAGDEKRHRGASRYRHALLFSHGTCVTRRPC